MNWPTENQRPRRMAEYLDAPTKRTSIARHMGKTKPARKPARCLGRAMALLAIFLFTSCRTIPPLPSVNLSEPGWALHQGQAVWRSKTDAPEIAGEILFATQAQGRTMLQMTKTPLPFVTVQTRGEEWEIEFVPQHRTFSGRGTPTPRLLWIHLARALNGTKPPAPLKFEQTEPHGFTLENPKTGEMISGFLN